MLQFGIIVCLLGILVLLFKYNINKKTYWSQVLPVQAILILIQINIIIIENGCIFVRLSRLNHLSDFNKVCLKFLQYHTEKWNYYKSLK